MEQSEKLKQHVIAGLILVSAPFSVSAIEPAAIPIGEMRLYPSLSYITGHDDNILATETDKKSSWITRINPNIALQAETENMQVRINYAIEKGILHSSSQDNYLDHNLTTTANIIGNSRNRIDLEASIIKGHEARGDENGGATSITSAPLEFDLNSAKGTYTFGGKEAKGRVLFNAGYQDKKFTNFRSITDTRDYDQSDIGMVFKYKITAKTSAVATVTRSKIDYDQSNKDSTKQRYLLGASWEATAKTTGSIDIGWSDKDFKDPSLSDVDGGTWNADITWSPKTYSTINFSTGQDFGESTTADAYIDATNYAVNWDHYWKDDLKSVVSYTTSIDDFGNSDRKDTTNTFVLGLNHELKRWLNFGVGYTHTDSDSNLAGSSFKKNTLLFTVQASL
jgi:hypothetical protein